MPQTWESLPLIGLICFGIALKFVEGREITMESMKVALGSEI